MLDSQRLCFDMQLTQVYINRLLGIGENVQFSVQARGSFGKLHNDQLIGMAKNRKRGNVA
jgi:hypothetical protein